MHCRKESAGEKKIKLKVSLCYFICFRYMINMLERVMSWFSPRFFVERKCIWRTHLIKALLADESWRRNKNSACLARQQLLLLDCFMEDMNLIHFQRQFGNSRQQRKGLPLDLAVFLWIALVWNAVSCASRVISGGLQCVGIDPLFLSSRDLGASVPGVKHTGFQKAGELAASAAATSVEKFSLTSNQSRSQLHIEDSLLVPPWSVWLLSAG